MRGAARVGGRSFKMPQGKEPTGGLNPFEYLIPISDLPVAPVLVPINDEWSISNFDDPVNEKDCAAYPASPYCDNELFAPTFMGFEPEIKTNGCETCLYVYPVIVFLKVQPTIICKRDPNCDREPEPPPQIGDLPRKPKRYNENVQPNAYKSQECADRESIINIVINRENDSVEEWLKREQSYYIETIKARTDALAVGYRLVSFSFKEKPYTENGIRGASRNCCEINPRYFYLANGKMVFSTMADMFKKNAIYVEVTVQSRDGKKTFTENLMYLGAFGYQTWEVGACCGMPEIKPPPPPPPYRDDGTNNRRGTERPNRKKPRRKKDDDDMCCNECRDAVDKTNTVLKEIREMKKVLGAGKLEKALNAAVGIGDDSITGIVNLLAKRIGTSRYPVEVPESLLTGVGDKVQKVESMTDYLYWLTHQFDALVGEFPIKIEVDDIDPLTEGKQPKTLEIDNIAEALAETYALSLKNAINQEVELNVLFRLAGEVIATKNCTAITQDYVKANATFLGYKGNQKDRELTYNFDLELTKDGIPSADTLERMLKSKKAFIQGWEINDKETVVGFLQKLMFAAGIIKAVFFRGKKRLKTFNDELTRMATDAKEGAANWDKFVRDIEDPDSDFNKDASEKPEIKEIRKTPPSP